MAAEQKSSFVWSQTSSLIGKNEIHRAEYANVLWKEFIRISESYLNYLTAHLLQFHDYQAFPACCIRNAWGAQENICKTFLLLNRLFL